MTKSITSKLFEEIMLKCIRANINLVVFCLHGNHPVLVLWLSYKDLTWHSEECAVSDENAFRIFLISSNFSLHPPKPTLGASLVCVWPGGQ